MKLLSFQFGELKHGWSQFKIITDVKELCWEISDVPRDPFAEFETALSKIINGLDMDDIYMFLEPQILILKYDSLESKLVISLEGITQAEINVNITEMAYFISMSLKRVYSDNSNAYHDKNWSYPIPL